MGSIDRVQLRGRRRTGECGHGDNADHRRSKTPGHKSRV